MSVLIHKYTHDIGQKTINELSQTISVVIEGYINKKLAASVQVSLTTTRKIWTLSKLGGSS